LTYIRLKDITSTLLSAVIKEASAAFAEIDRYRCGERVTGNLGFPSRREERGFSRLVGLRSVPFGSMLVTSFVGMCHGRLVG